MLESAAWIWLSGFVFALFHSLTASQTCKQLAYGMGLKEPRYRLFYSLVALITTGVWAWYIHHLPDVTLYQSTSVVWWSLLALQVLGGLIALAAFAPIDGLVFLGLKTAQDTQDPFVISGIYRWIRHPMYTGAMLILLAMPGQTWNGLNFSLVLCVYFIVGSKFEEKRMIAAHPAYREYQQNVPAFLFRNTSGHHEKS